MLKRNRWLLIAVLVVGCGKKYEPGTSGRGGGGDGYPSGGQEVNTLGTKQAKTRDQLKAEREAFLAGLKTDPAPIFAKAREDVLKSVRENLGDESADAAVITVDTGSLRTFGGERWTVKGRVTATDADGKARTETWLVTLDAEPFKAGLCRITLIEYKEAK